MTDLARRAVACARWRWMPGMLVLDHGPGVRLAGVSERFLHGSAAESPTNDHGPSWMRIRRDRETLPNLEDATTLGCLLALVREAWGNPTIHTQASGPYWIVVAGAGWSGDDLTGEQPSEASALISALEAAP